MIPLRATKGETEAISRINSKTFSLDFDGGQVDPYHVQDRKGRFKGSQWVRLSELRWLIGEMGKVYKLPHRKSSFFQFLRDGYRTLELSSLSNQGGRFIEISEEGYRRVARALVGLFLSMS